MLIPRLTVAIIVLSIFATGCSDKVSENLPLIEVSEYSEEQVLLGEAPEIYIMCDNANIKMFTWDSREVKIEIKKRARGRLDKELLREKLGDFDINIVVDGNKFLFNSAYKKKVKPPSERIVDLVLYIPKNVTLLDYKTGRGSLKIYDDVNCTLQADFDNADMDINRFSGCFNIRGDTGNLSISGGKINGNSSISFGSGNIKIKAQFDNSGKYSFETGLGNIELALPENTKISALCIGKVDVNEFQSLKYPAAIKLKNSMGRISAVGF